MKRDTYFRSLRMMLRLAEFRRFRARNRHTGRYAEILGFGPSGKAVVGWLEGTEELTEFEPDEPDWTEPTVYV